MAEPLSMRRQLTRLELTVCTAVLALLVGVALRSMTGLMAVAEQHRLTATVNELRAGLTLAAATRLVRGDNAGIARLVAANPLESVVRRKRAYVGERADGEAGTVPGGSWFYDASSRLLVYRVEHAARFETGLAGPRRARFRVVVRYRDGDGDGVFGGLADRFEAIDLRAVEPYRWKGRAT